MPYTTQQLAELTELIASATQRVTMGDRTVSHHDLEEMQKLRARMIEEIAAANGVKRPRTFKLTQTGTGL